MVERPLTHTLAATFAALDDLAQRDADARAHAQAQQRIAFLRAQLHALQSALRQLRVAVTLVQHIDPAHEITALWSNTCAELKVCAPGTLHAPGRALAEGHLDLLQLVEYTAASVAIVRERYHWVTDQLARHPRVVALDRVSCACDARRAAIDTLVSRLASAKEPWNGEGALRSLEALLSGAMPEEKRKDNA